VAVAVVKTSAEVIATKAVAVVELVVIEPLLG
jgi:hypothetical protein